MYLCQNSIINVNMIVIDCIVPVLKFRFVIIYTTHMQVTNVLVLTSENQTRKKKLALANHKQGLFQLFLLSCEN